MTRPRPSLLAVLAILAGAAPLSIGRTPEGLAARTRRRRPAASSRLPFWRNTEVASLASGDTAVLGHGILGPEWDEDLDNGARPANLVRLSETTVDGVPYVQDWGLTYDSGTATHAMTLYRAAGGALVFSAGTPQFSWGLDEHHNYWTGTPRVRPHPDGPARAIRRFRDSPPTSATTPARRRSSRSEPIRRGTVSTSIAPATMAGRARV